MLVVVILKTLGFVLATNALMAYLMFIKLDEIEGYLTTATWVTPAKNMLKGTGWLSKFHRLTLISALFIVPNLFVRRGDVDAHELSRFPRKLKRLVLGAYAFGVVAAIEAIGVYFYLRVTD
jgi:hypothetical protein